MNSTKRRPSLGLGILFAMFLVFGLAACDVEAASEADASETSVSDSTGSEETTEESADDKTENDTTSESQETDETLDLSGPDNDGDEADDSSEADTQTPSGPEKKSTTAPPVTSKDTTPLVSRTVVTPSMPAPKPTAGTKPTTESSTKPTSSTIRDCPKYLAYCPDTTSPRPTECLHQPTRENTADGSQGLRIFPPECCKPTLTDNTGTWTTRPDYQVKWPCRSIEY